MIIGIGCDLIEIERVKKSIERPRFLERCFSPAEIELFAARKDAAVKLAGCFAVKEAFGKALGTGIAGFALSDITVLRNEAGKPFIALSGRALALAEVLSAKLHATITNTKDHAMAVVILEEK